EKADAIKATVEGAVTEDVPASVLQNHDNVILILDQAAASKLV
ncbi:glucosamine-6-phosphate deaminase, partial [Streptococcus suis]